MVAFYLLSCLLGMSRSIADEQGRKKLSVKLHKQLVPVRNADHKIVAHKSAYFGTIFVGGPVPQEFSVVFDTGSGHVVLPSSECSSPTCLIHRRYSRQESSSSRDIDYNGQLIKEGDARDAITIAFGTGEVSGEFVEDKICLPQPDDEDSILEGSPKVASNDCVDMRVVAATEMTQEPFQSFSFDGVMGLGLDGLALAPEFSFFSRMVKQGQLGAPEFAVFLAEHEDDESEITFGGYNPAHLQGDITWTPVAMPELGHWQVEVLGVRIGNVNVPWCNSTDKCRAVVDTGTSLLAAPKDFQPEFQELLGTEIPKGQNTCKGQILTKNLLEFDLAGGFTVSLAVEDLAHAPLDIQANSSESSRSMCVPAIMPLGLPEPLGPNLFILGEPVLRKYYTLYNWEKKEIGFGRVPPMSPQLESTLLV